MSKKLTLKSQIIKLLADKKLSEAKKADLTAKIVEQITALKESADIGNVFTEELAKQTALIKQQANDNNQMAAANLELVKTQAEELSKQLEQNNQTIAAGLTNLSVLMAELAVKDTGIDKAVATLLENGNKNSEAFIKALNKLSVKVQKPDWYKAPSDEVNVKNTVKVEVINQEKQQDVEKPIKWLFSALTVLLTKLKGLPNIVRHEPDHYLTPQTMVLIDPEDGKPIGRNDIGAVAIARANANGSGTGGGTIDTSGIISVLEEIAANTDGLEITAENVNLNTDTLEAKLQSILTAVDGLETQLTTALAELSGIAGFSAGAATETTLAGLGTGIQNISAEIVARTNLGKKIKRASVELTSSGTVIAPTVAGNQIRVFSYKVSLDSNMNSVALRFGAAGTDFAKFLAPKAGGYYGDNSHPDYDEGDPDQELYAEIDGTGTVQINISYLEITP